MCFIITPAVVPWWVVSAAESQGELEASMFQVMLSLIIKQFVLRYSISCLVIDLRLLGVAFLSLSKLLIVILSQYSLINLL